MGFHHERPITQLCHVLLRWIHARDSVGTSDGVYQPSVWTASCGSLLQLVFLPVGSPALVAPTRTWFRPKIGTGQRSADRPRARSGKTYQNSLVVVRTRHPVGGAVSFFRPIWDMRYGYLALRKRAANLYLAGQGEEALALPGLLCRDDLFDIRVGQASPDRSDLNEREDLDLVPRLMTLVPGLFYPLLVLILVVAITLLWSVFVAPKIARIFWNSICHYRFSHNGCSHGPIPYWLESCPYCLLREPS